MDKKFHTIMFFSGKTSYSKQLKVSLKRSKQLKKIAVLTAVAFAFGIYDYASMKLNFSNLSSLKAENTAQKIKLQEMSSQINNFHDQLAKLEGFDRKLRVIANLDIPETSNRFGMGGSMGDDEYMITLGDKRDDLVSRISTDINDLEERSFVQEKSFTELQEFFLKQSSLLASTPAIWPAKGWVTSNFGKRTSPFTGRTQIHKGMDIANRVGTNIIAPADGVVTKVHKYGGLGKSVTISHGYGIVTRFGHLSGYNVKVGQKVKRGDNIAFMGNTGRSTGPHLHYEVFVNGSQVNPDRYLLN